MVSLQSTISGPTDTRLAVSLHGESFPNRTTATADHGARLHSSLHAGTKTI